MNHSSRLLALFAAGTLSLNASGVQAAKASATAAKPKPTAQAPLDRKYVDTILANARALAAKHDFDGAVKEFVKAQALAFGMDLPAEYQAQIQDDLDEAMKFSQIRFETRMNQVYRRQSHYYSGEQSTLQFHDTTEEEYLRKVAIQFAKQRFGAQSATHVRKHAEYLRFLAKQQRGDEVAAEASVIHDLFATLPPRLQADVAVELMDAAHALADAKFLMSADTIGSAVAKGVENGKLTQVPELSTRLTQLAESFDRHSDAERAQKYFAASVRAVEKQVGPDDPGLARMRIKLAQFYKRSGKIGAATELMEMAVGPQTVLGKYNSEIVDAVTTLAELYVVSGSRAKAKETAERVIALLSTVPGNSSLPTKSLMMTARYMANEGEHATAEKLFEATFKAMRKNDHNNHWAVQELVREIATTYSVGAPPEQIDKLFDLLVQSKNNADGEPTGSTLTTYLEIANYYAQQESMTKAKQAADNALATLKKITPSDRSDRLNELSTQFENHGEYETALKLEQAWITLNAHRSGYDSQLINARLRMARLYNKAANQAEAQRLLTEMKTEMLDNLSGRFKDSKPVIASAIDELLAKKDFDGTADLLAALADADRYDSFGDGLARVAQAMISRQMQAAAIPLFETALAAQIKGYGASSVQAASLMSQYAYLLRHEGSAQRAAEMDEGHRAIYALHSRQNQLGPGGEPVYKPFAPLAETIQQYKALGLDQGNSSPTVIRRSSVRPLPRPINHVPR